MPGETVRVRDCFGCGPANPIGLQLAGIRRDGDVVRATLRPRGHYQSYPGMLHGGISATALDEVMCWAGVLLGGMWPATASMDVRYRAQVPLDVALELEAGLDTVRPRRARAWGRLLLPDGGTGVEATGVLVALPPELAARSAEVYGPLA